MKVRPMGMLLMMLAGSINRHQQDATVRIRVSLVQPPFRPWAAGTNPLGKDNDDERNNVP